jgi:plastocyanin
MSRRVWISAVLALCLIAGAIWFFKVRDHGAGELKAEHAEDTTPHHGEIYAAAPIQVVVNANTDIQAGSTLSVSNAAGETISLGEVAIDDNKLAMRRDFPVDAADGLYMATYSICVDGGSCDEGSFQFTIDRSLQSTFIDLTGQEKVSIVMKDIVFSPQKIKISPGTEVTWIHDDIAEHFVNTESHPFHTYFPKQNSRSLRQGDSYSVVFDTPGLYPYHCSAHAAVMTGEIIVQ